MFLWVPGVCSREGAMCQESLGITLEKHSRGLSLWSSRYSTFLISYESFLQVLFGKHFSMVAALDSLYSQTMN